MREFLMRRIAGTAALVVCLLAVCLRGGALLAQDPVQRNLVTFTFDDAVRQLGLLSAAYRDGLIERQKAGVFRLEPDVARDLYGRLDQLVGILKRPSRDRNLKAPELSDLNQNALLAALTCQNCSGDVGPGGRSKYLETLSQLQALFIARCGAIEGLLRTRDGAVSRDSVLAIEIHLNYLILITATYLGT